MKKCELCRSVARTHCESDQASLCWTCDYKVHAANFLVARHSRTLLCHVCQSPTQWSATGTKLGPTVSVCNHCIRNSDSNNEGKVAYVDDADVEIESDGSSDEAAETSSDEEEIDNEDNQVVPWSPTTPPPAASSSSDSDGESYSSSSSSSSSSLRDRRKRMRQNVSDLRLNANHSSSRENVSIPPGTVASPAVACGGWQRACEKSLKRRRLLDSSRVGSVSPNSRAIVDSFKRIHRQDMRSSAAVAEFLRISEDPLAVDGDFAECSQP